MKNRHFCLIMMGFNGLSISIVLAPNGKRQEENGSNNLFISYADEMYRSRIFKKVKQKGNDVQFNSLWLCVVFNSHSHKDCLSYAKVKDMVISFLCSAYLSLSLISQQVLCDGNEGNNSSLKNLKNNAM